MPQDVKLSSDGKVFYIADMVANGVYIVDATTFRVIAFQPTGNGAHGLYISRDSTRMFVTNRDEGTISVINLATRRPEAKWRLPGGGSPDMGNVSANGKLLWLSGRYNNVVYATQSQRCNGGIAVCSAQNTLIDILRGNADMGKLFEPTGPGNVLRSTVVC